jgi:hypothetical protein
MSASPPGVVLKHLAGRDKYRRTRGEQETILRWDRAGDHVQVWLASPVTWRKLQRVGIPPVCETRCSGGLVSSCFYRIPLTRLRWGLKRVGSGRQDGVWSSGAWRR